MARKPPWHGVGLRGATDHCWPTQVRWAHGRKDDGAPTCPVSNSSTLRLGADWAISSRSAARPKRSSEASTTKKRSSRGVTSHDKQALSQDAESGLGAMRAEVPTVRSVERRAVTQMYVNGQWARPSGNDVTRVVNPATENWWPRSPTPAPRTWITRSRRRSGRSRCGHRSSRPRDATDAPRRSRTSSPRWAARSRCGRQIGQCPPRRRRPRARRHRGDAQCLQQRGPDVRRVDQNDPPPYPHRRGHRTRGSNREGLRGRRSPRSRHHDRTRDLGPTARHRHRLRQRGHQAGRDTGLRRARPPIRAGPRLLRPTNDFH